MKKYTDTELLETLLPMLYYSISTSTIGDTVDFGILERTCCGIQKDFVVALQDRINELAKKAR